MFQIQDGSSTCRKENTPFFHMMNSRRWSAPSAMHRFVVDSSWTRIRHMEHLETPNVPIYHLPLDSRHLVPRRLNFDELCSLFHTSRYALLWSWNPSRSRIKHSALQPVAAHAPTHRLPSRTTPTRNPLAPLFPRPPSYQHTAAAATPRAWLIFPKGRGATSRIEPAPLLCLRDVHANHSPAMPGRNPEVS